MSWGVFHDGRTGLSTLWTFYWSLLHLTLWSLLYSTLYWSLLVWVSLSYLQLTVSPTKLMIRSLSYSRNSRNFIAPEGSLPCLPEPPLVTIPCQNNQVHTFPPYFPKIHSNIKFPSMLMLMSYYFFSFTICRTTVAELSPQIENSEWHVQSISLYQSIQWLDCGLDDRGSIPGRCWKFLSPASRPDLLWGPPSLQSNGYQGLLHA
jgi:hypothetical protein